MPIDDLKAFFAKLETDADLQAKARALQGSADEERLAGLCLRAGCLDELHEPDVLAQRQRFYVSIASGYHRRDDPSMIRYNHRTAGRLQDVGRQRLGCLAQVYRRHSSTTSPPMRSWLPCFTPTATTSTTSGSCDTS